MVRFPEGPSLPLLVRAEGQQGRRGQAALGSSYLVTSGALTGRTFFLRASIQLRRIPEVIADRVKTASFVCNREVTEALSALSGCAAAPSCSLRHTVTHIYQCWAVRKATLCLRLLGTVEGWEEERWERCLRASCSFMRPSPSKGKKSLVGTLGQTCTGAVQLFRCQESGASTGVQQQNTGKPRP